MGDKRYYYNIFDDGTEYIEDYWGNEHYFNLDDVEELLNEQQFTIEQLQKENKQLQKENKRLKESNDELEDELEESSAFIIEQREENKQLKEQVQILKKEVRDLLHLCDVCDIQSHLSDECEEVLNDE